MKNVNVILATTPTSFAAGTQGGDFLFIMGEQGNTAHDQKIVSPNTSVTFADVKPGLYWIEAARLDRVNEAVLGQKARVAFEVAEDNVLIETADIIGVTLTDA